MTRPQYAPVPRGYVRVWVVSENGGRVWWTYKSARRAANLAAGIGGTVTPLDVPAGAIPGLAARRERKR